MAQRIYGRNTVRSALKEGKVSRIFMVPQLKDEDILSSCREQSIPVITKTAKEISRLVEGNHQGVIAEVSPYRYADFSPMIAHAKSVTYPLLIMLDGITDPHNLGAILRSADAFGCQGIIVGKHDQVPLTATVAKVSTGAIDHVPVCQVTNLNTAIRQLKEEGFWVIASDGEAQNDYRAIDYRMPVVLVIGSEGKGVSRLVMENSDLLVKIPMCGHVNSLNASVATAVLLAQIYHNRFPL